MGRLAWPDQNVISAIQATSTSNRTQRWARGIGDAQQHDRSGGTLAMRETQNRAWLGRLLVSPMVIERLRGDGWSRVVRLVAPIGAFVLEGWPALMGALLVQEGGLWLAGRLAGGCHRTFARGLFLGAFGLRVAIALPTHYVAKLGNGSGALFQDDYTNDLVA